MFTDVDWVIIGVGAKNGSSKIPFFRARRIITDSLPPFREMDIPRESMIAKIDDKGQKVFTMYQDDMGENTLGEKVSVTRRKYLRTDMNNIAMDNLENLPVVERLPSKL
ncbi:MAG: hypothetical protein K8R76_11140 [Candidatus Aegiribacteria sp.]|nr:hypothetical protein [Candidatus Aegiribacteria sp.]